MLLEKSDIFKTIPEYFKTYYRILIGIPNERAVDFAQYASKEFHSPRHSWEYKWLKIFVAPIECVQLKLIFSKKAIEIEEIFNVYVFDIK